MLPTLRTERLVLRRWRAADAATAFEIYSQWDVARFLGSTPRLGMERLGITERYDDVPCELFRIVTRD
jgi:RimJ/RimL family protein N-acetyltransferase